MLSDKYRLQKIRGAVSGCYVMLQRVVSCKRSEVQSVGVMLQKIRGAVSWGYMSYREVSGVSMVYIKEQVLLPSPGRLS